MDWVFDSYEEMGKELAEFSLEAGLNFENADIEAMLNEGLPGVSILGKVDGADMIFIAIGSEEENVAVLGIISYDPGYRSEAIELSKRIYLTQ